ncbi:helix-turn-helix transcriptional regulator [Chryseobacterium luquanense]|uniref:Helix-turn-helix domain-containing protein n=1 Tax=Chryseobacterium luquanense TaxID=2983766 RepID=A0ABT3Y5H6_9FLAO|nr:helix-turn-helix transcriptional regulator [Chryseobacterium luquanense]MCX8533405.1 helix-turn-helix domain-containing protein [Chryseobacterium luquanense]
MKIGKKLREFRYKNNNSQQEVAELLNISQSTYCDWESDRTFPKFENLSKIAKLYNIDINDLISSEKGNNINLVTGSETTEVLLKVSEKLDKLVEVVEKLIEKK